MVGAIGAVGSEGGGSEKAGENWDRLQQGKASFKAAWVANWARRRGDRGRSPSVETQEMERQTL